MRGVHLQEVSTYGRCPIMGGVHLWEVSTYGRIAKRSGYKTSELESLGEGQTLIIGGKEIEWENNQGLQQIVDVVVDPHISQHLRPHQREGVVFLYECVLGLRNYNGNGAILGDEMGLGKTLQCIALLWTLHKQNPYGSQPLCRRTLVITPGSLVKNWCSEFRKWLGNERMKVYPVTAEKRVKEFSISPIYPVLIISYEMFIRSMDEIMDIKFDLIICDEAHRLKNSCIKTTTNDLKEFHSLIELSNPGVLGSQALFRRVYEQPIIQGQQPNAACEDKLLGQTRVTEPSGKEVAIAILTLASGTASHTDTMDDQWRVIPTWFSLVTRSGKGGVELQQLKEPSGKSATVETVVFCRPSQLQLSLYRQLLTSRVVRSCIVDSSGGSRHLMCIAALKKICNHPTLVYEASKDVMLEIDEETSLYDGLLSVFPQGFDKQGLNLEMSGKLETLSKMLGEIFKSNEHVVVVSNYTQLISGLKTKRRILLTGTPIQNDLKEFHSLIELSNPGVLGSQALFRRVYEQPIIQGQQPNAACEDKLLGQTRVTELNRLTSLFFLRRTAEINYQYLPSKVETVVFCRPSQLQLSLYRQLLTSRVVRSCIVDSSGGSRHLMCIAALKKICNHPTLVYEASEDVMLEIDEETSLYDGLLSVFPQGFDKQGLNLEMSGKLETLSKMLGEIFKSNERVVVVSNYTQTLDIIQRLCQVREYTFVRLDGSTPTAKRQSIVDRFNTKYSKDFVFLLSSKAGGVGLNLIGASRLILYDIDWNPANDLQAMARVWRDGQKKKVHIYRLLTTGTIEEKIYQRQTTKQSLSGAVADAKKEAKVEFTIEDIR
ncbi:hypothetical protein QZH41_013249, partial [Actinostola sp. cb2023]